MRILIVEDEKKMAALLKLGLEEEAHAVTVAYNGTDALQIARTYDFDVMVLDVMLPGVDGFEVARRLRKEDNRVPILMLTARDAVQDRVKGLDLGADDYLSKPFSFVEFLARVRALQRRPRGVDSPVISRGRLELDPARRQITGQGKSLPLTVTEYKILELLMRRSPTVVERKAIAEHAWQDKTDPLGSNTIDVQMSRLRAKLVNAGVRIVTVRGAGFRLEES